MKKILLSLLVLCGTLTSCDMDLSPAGKLDDSTAIESANDCFRFRNGIYSSIRSMGAGGWITNTEMQMDQFNGLISNGNRMGVLANGNISSSNGDIKDIWAGLYGRIASVNYFLGKAEAILASGTLTEDDRLAVERYIGEAHFARAYYYFYMMDHFCQAYTAERGSQPALGLPLVTVFNPTGLTGSYPGRSTMDETLKLINDDLDMAMKALADYEVDHKENLAPNASYLSTWTVKALKARIALHTADYASAMSIANDFINNSPFKLAKGDAYADMWVYDESDELIFVPFVDSSESGSIGNTSNSWISYQDVTSSDYIPSQTTLMAYDEGDIRFDLFFTVWKLTIEGGNYPSYVFYKYPGNPDLVGSGINYRKNKPKPFRLSEIYLIAAEAAAADGKVADANRYLNALRAARIEGYEDANYNASAIMDAVRAERSKELIGEGFRMSDLRRWGLGFTRDASYEYVNPDLESVLVRAGMSVRYEANDYRYVWPIPADEMDINPQLKGQQNPGY